MKNTIKIFLVAMIFQSQFAYGFGDNKLFKFVRDKGTETSRLEEEIGHIVVEPKDIKQAVTVANAQTSPVDPELYGIFWLDGVSSQSVAMSFTNTGWDVEKERSNIPVYGSKNWSWRATDEGYEAQGTTIGSRLVYKFDFNDDLTKANILPRLTMYGRFRINYPRFLMRFDMDKIDEHNWIRKTYFFGIRYKPADYFVRRIIDGDGNPVPGNYEKFLAEAPPLIMTPVFAENEPKKKKPKKRRSFFSWFR